LRKEQLSFLTAKLPKVIASTCLACVGLTSIGELMVIIGRLVVSDGQPYSSEMRGPGE
jgi:hypothetical protein